DAPAPAAAAPVALAALPAPVLKSDAPTATPVDPATSTLANSSIVLTPPSKAKAAQPEAAVLASADSTTTEADSAEATAPVEIVTRVSTSGGQEWGINVGSFPSRYNAERELLRTALVEMATLNNALRKVSSSKGAFDANFVGMTQDSAELACRRLAARGTECKVLGPTASN
ncbi:MAG: D-alanyl-D-alanine carboxypeptidase, partial [Rhodobacteraceae bacterium]|nr:D-alanyl-D-alanine carboxypeptidase [Paracoccaceae bacterium]